MRPVRIKPNFLMSSFQKKREIWTKKKPQLSGCELLKIRDYQILEPP